MSDTNNPVVLQVNHLNYSEVVMNTPKTLNSISISHVQALHKYFKMCRDNNAVKFVIFRGIGRAFCAGGDIKSIAKVATNKPEEFGLLPFSFHDLLYLLAGLRKPVICYMDGITAGGGLGFALLSTFKIATENTVVSLPEGRIGHFCDATNSYFMSRLDGYLGVYLALTGHAIKAEDVVFAGLATHFVPSSQLEALGERLSSLQDLSLDAIDSAIQDVAVTASHTPSQYTLFGRKLEIIERCFKYETVEEIMEALKNEDSKFAQSCLKTMADHCPLSLKVTLHAIRRGADSTIYQTIDRESRGWSTIPLSYNYKEGVKALLCEKRRPQWKPARVEDVTEDIESTYFPKENLNYTIDINGDFMTSPYQKYLPPTRSEVRYIQMTKGLNSRKEVLTWFLKDRKYKFGTREIVESIFSKQNRRTVASPSISETYRLRTFDSNL